MAKRKQKQKLKDLVNKYGGGEGNRDGKVKAQNFVSKHSRDMSGAGAHEDKKGEKAPRSRQKRQWKKEAMDEHSLIAAINVALLYENSDTFEQSLADIEQEFGINLSEGFSAQQKADMTKLVGQYKGKSNVRDKLGNDLEMLEYQPDEVSAMITHIVSELQK